MTGSKIRALPRWPSSLPTSSSTTDWAPCSCERLTETARHAGIGEFRASVLAENSTMLAVFHGADFP